jgi:hypothetical protein
MNFKKIIMKQSIIFSLFLSILLFSCRKEDNPKLPDLTRVPTPLLTKVANTDQVISVQDPTAFKGSFTVDLFFKGDAPPQKMDVVLIKNGDKGNVKMIQENITTFPTTVQVTGPQLATLFGAAIKLGDRFDVGVDVTAQSGLKYQAFPSVGEAYGSGVANQPGSSTSIRYEAVCKYDPSIYEGTFVVEEDVWEDYHPGDEIQITKIDDNSFSFTHVAAINPVPVVIVVNPNDNSAKITKQSVGTRWAYGAIYTGPFVATAGSPSDSFVSPCERSVTLNMQYGFSGGTFAGTYPLKLKKKQ